MGGSSHRLRAWEKLAPVVEAKLIHDGELLSGLDWETELGGFTYREFWLVHEYLLIKCHYHRHYARINDVDEVVQFPKADLAHEICIATSLPEADVTRVLEHLSYSRANRRLAPMYFGIVSHPESSCYIVVPSEYIARNGFVQLLRVQASAAPNHFLSRLSNVVGDGLVRQAAREWEAAGFLSKKNLMLDQVVKGAPDIDLLVASREPTLGYVVFIIEAKATLPALWGKDHVRVRNRDGLAKAFDQLDAVMSVLTSEEGAALLWSTLQELDPEPLPEGVVAVQSLVLTYQNTGMLLDDLRNDTQVVDLQTLRQILLRCDGDVLYVQQMLRDLGDLFSRDDDIAQAEFEVGDRCVVYDIYAPTRHVMFRQNVWRSDGSDVAMAREFLDGGESRFDAFFSDRDDV